MTKRFVFLLVLLLALMASTVTASANAYPQQEGVTEDEIRLDFTAPGRMMQYETLYKEEFFGEQLSNGKDFQVTLSARREVLAADPLRFILSGYVGQMDGNATETVVVLLYIKRDGVFVPLKIIDGQETREAHLLETPTLLYAKARLDNLGNDKVNDLRIVAFRRSDVDRLELNENLQVTDIQVVARSFTVMDRLRLGIYEVKSSFTFFQ